MKRLETSDMKTSSNNKEKRKGSRTMVSLPLHFQANENEGVYPGLTIDASETGLLIQTLRETPVGTRKLRQILSNILCLKEIDIIERRDHPPALVVRTE